MRQGKNRKQYLDIAKGIGIILVVIGHCPQVYNPLKQWIYAFHMPLFFIISGMVWNRESHEKRGFFTRKFVVDKLKRLIIPCYIWGVLYMMLDTVMNRSFSPMKIAYLIYGSQSGFSHAGSLTSLWFLPCMFIAVCLFEIVQQKLRKLEKRSILLFIICVMCAMAGLFLPRISGGYPWSIDVSFLALAFMMWGHLGRECIERIGERKVLAVLCAIACLGILTATFGLNLRNISINNADMAGRYFGNPMLYLFDAITGSLFILLVSELISGQLGKGLVELGKRTIPIFIIHKPIVQALNKVGTAISAPSFVIAIISVAIAICISNLVYVGLRKLVPIVFGEKKAN